MNIQAKSILKRFSGQGFNGEVPVVPGPAEYEPPKTEFKPFEPAVTSESTVLDRLLDGANAGEGIRNQAHNLLGRIAVDPNDRRAQSEYYDLQRLLTSVSATEEARAARPQALTGRDRVVAQMILDEQIAFPHGHDVEAINVLRGALSVGETAVEAVVPATVSAEAPQPVAAAARLYASAGVGRHHAQ